VDEFLAMMPELSADLAPVPRTSPPPAALAAIASPV
jgi:hypothetical protein